MLEGLTKGSRVYCEGNHRRSLADGVNALANASSSTLSHQQMKLTLGVATSARAHVRCKLTLCHRGCDEHVVLLDNRNGSLRLHDGPGEPGCVSLSLLRQAANTTKCVAFSASTFSLRVISVRRSD